MLIPALVLQVMGQRPAGALKALPANAADFADNTCYLIRRTSESYATIIPNGENTNITNLLLLGMPNPSDLMYDFVPEEAKTAWARTRRNMPM